MIIAKNVPIAPIAIGGIAAVKHFSRFEYPIITSLFILRHWDKEAQLSKNIKEAYVVPHLFSVSP